jgi:hypothetical protein
MHRLSFAHVDHLDPAQDHTCPGNGFEPELRDAGGDIEWRNWAAGYTIAGSVALRIPWGFVGSWHARYSGHAGSIVCGEIGRSSSKDATLPMP